MRRLVGKKQVETHVWEVVCDSCGKVIDTNDNLTNERRISLSWGVLDYWWDAEMGEEGVPDSPADLCSSDCTRALLARMDALLVAAESGSYERPQ